MACSSRSCRPEFQQRLLRFPQSSMVARGLTKALAAAFYPGFSAAVALRQLPARPKKRGLWLGNQLDRAVAAWVEGQDQNKSQDPRLARVQDALAERGWTPVAAQVPVGCSALRLATRADLVCADREGRLVLLELKSGFDDYYDCGGQGEFLGPCAPTEMTYRRIHLLQLRLTRWLFEHCPPPALAGRPLHPESFVLRVFEDAQGELQPELTAASSWPVPVAALVACLRSTKDETSRERNRLITNGKARTRYSYILSKRRLRTKTLSLP